MDTGNGADVIRPPGRWALHRAFNQNLFMSATLFLTVGIYLAILSLGAGGGKASSLRVSDISNSVLYALLFLVGMCGGSILNILGPRLTLMIGAFGYPFYVAGFFYYDRTGHEWFPILGGAVLGVCGALLWTTAGFVQFGYATEKDKGLYIGMQYTTFQTGSLVASIIAFAIVYTGTNLDDGEPDAVYIAFIVIMCMSLITAAFLVDPRKVRRDDGTALANFTSLTAVEEITGALKAFKDWRILLISVAIFSCEFEISLIPTVNASYFNSRTRALNSIVYYAVSPPMAILISKMLDCRRFGRRTHGFITTGFVSLFLIPSWIGMLVFLTDSKWSSPPEGGYDWNEIGYGGPIVLFMCWGVCYTIHQFLLMWIMALFSNDPKTNAVYGGIFKGVAAAGVAVTFGMSAGGVTNIVLAICMCVVQLLSLPIAAFLIYSSRETNYGLEEDVIVPKYAVEEAIEAPRSVGDSALGESITESNEKAI